MFPKARSIRNRWLKTGAGRPCSFDQQCICGPRSLAWVACVAFALGVCCAQATAEDTVYVSSSANAQARAKITGRITDFNGRELIVVTGGVEKRYPASQIAEVESDWTPAQLAADELFAKRDYAAALAKYEDAVRADKRRWVQRRIVAQMIWCLRNLDQYRRAGELFLALARDDPALLDFAVIPLRWLPAQMPADLEKKSQEWLASDAPIAVLLGASHRLGGADRAEIIKRLEPLTADKDPRIAALAAALVWNATFPSANAKQLASWEEGMERCPDAVRAGPYFALGRALAHHQQFDRAAINLLHVPILYPEDRPLAAAALLAAGQALEQTGDRESAAGVYRELLAGYTQPRPVAEARERLQQLEAAPKTSNEPAGK